MSDPLSTNPVRAPEPQDEADREARIEELLLSGLDHYFAGQYERAISVWTRIVFLDRHHDRARAYIERARSALAERQRESDECLHDGVAAYNAGDVEAARRLLTRAVEQGSDGAAVFLDRLDRLAPVGRPGGAAVESRMPRTLPRGPHAAPRMPRTLPRGPHAAPRQAGWLAVGLAAVGVAVLMLLGGLPLGTWLSELQVEPLPRTPAPADEPLPIVRRSESALVRARMLGEAGRLREALGALDGVGRADPLLREADALRADIQRALLGGGAPAASNGESLQP